jgi:2-polyprenyl-3-methyl-5-hydroxy-6-metoxy-1,4-benzoquinol methylase
MYSHLAPGQRAPDIDHLQWLQRDAGVDFRGRRFLDLGCGSGYLCAEAARAGAVKSVGVDLLPPGVATQGWEYQRVDLDGGDWHRQLDPNGEGFDVVSAFDILEHVTSPAHFVAACKELLRPNGRLIVTTPNTSSWERWLRPQHWSGATDPQHKILFCRYSLMFLLERSGFAVMSLRAPVRKLDRLIGRLAPQIGAQIICVARRV